MRRVFALIVAIATVAGARAQEEAPATPRQIEEIVVTAQKKEQSLQEVPISMTALPGDFVAEAGIDNVHEIAKFTPNVNFATNPCCPIIYIRGIGTSFNASSFDPTVGYTLDDLSISQSVYFAEPLYDIERIEVLRGPQGTLFGKNTTGGLFNLTTGTPTKEFTGSLIGRVGGLGVHRFEAAFGGPLGPLGDWAQFRLAVLEAQEAGDIENTLLGTRQPRAEQQAARLKLALQPFDGLDVLFIASRMKTDARAFQFQQHELRDSSVQLLRQHDPAFDDDGLNHKNSVNRLTLMERDTDLIQTNLRYEIGDLGPLHDSEIVAVVGYTGFDMSAPIDFDFSPMDIAYFKTPAPILYDQSSAELRFSSVAPAPLGFGELELLAGVLFFENAFTSDVPVVAGDDFEEFLLSAPGFELATGQQAVGGVGFEDLGAVADALGVALPPTGPLAGDGIQVFSDQESKSAGAFGQIDWHPTPAWTVSAGGRFTHEKKEANVFANCYEPGFVCLALAAREFNLDLERTESDFSPRFSAQYSPIEEVTLFATRAQGFKSGGFNNFSVTGNNIEVDAEEVVSWEVGAKGTALDGTVAYGAAFFNTDAEDIQVQNFVGTSIEVRNAASARARGVEMDFRWLTPFEPLSLFGAGAYTDARFKDYRNAQAPRGWTSNYQDLSGKRMPFVSEWQLNVTPTLRAPFALPEAATLGGWVPRDLALSTALDVFYKSDAFLDIDADPNTRQDGHVLLDGRVALATADDVLTFSVSVTNLTDEEVFEFLTDSTFFPGGYMGFQEFQRTWAAEVRFRW